MVENGYKTAKKVEDSFRKKWVSNFPSLKVFQFLNFPDFQFPKFQLSKRKGSGKWAEGEQKVSSRGAEGTSVSGASYWVCNTNMHRPADPGIHSHC